MLERPSSYGDLIVVLVMVLGVGVIWCLKDHYFQSFQWMSRVLQAVDSIHQVGIYCLALVPPNHLPKTPLGGIHLSETRKKFLEGSLHPANVLMCPHTCVTNLPKPREVHHGKQHHSLHLLAHSVTFMYFTVF